MGNLPDHLWNHWLVICTQRDTTDHDEQTDFDGWEVEWVSGWVGQWVGWWRIVVGVMHVGGVDGGWIVWDRLGSSGIV